MLLMAVEESSVLAKSSLLKLQSFLHENFRNRQPTKHHTFRNFPGNGLQGPKAFFDAMKSVSQVADGRAVGYHLVLSFDTRE